MVSALYDNLRDVAFDSVCFVMTQEIFVRFESQMRSERVDLHIVEKFSKFMNEKKRFLVVQRSGWWISLRSLVLSVSSVKWMSLFWFSRASKMPPRPPW